MAESIVFTGQGDATQPGDYPLLGLMMPSRARMLLELPSKPAAEASMRSPVRA